MSGLLATFCAPSQHSKQIARPLYRLLVIPQKRLFIRLKTRERPLLFAPKSTIPRGGMPQSMIKKQRSYERTMYCAQSLSPAESTPCASPSRLGVSPHSKPLLGQQAYFFYSWLYSRLYSLSSVVREPNLPPLPYNPK